MFAMVLSSKKLLAILLGTVLSLSTFLYSIDCRYSLQYPKSPLELHIMEAEGLSTEDVTGLSVVLNTYATEHKNEMQVYVFGLVETCQEFLREHNKGNEQEDEDSKVRRMQSVYEF